VSIRRALSAIVLGGAAYGTSIGASTDATHALFSAAKVPLLLLGTALLCGLACRVLALFLGARLPPRAVLAATLCMHADLASMLASLSPAVLFLGRTMVQPHDDELGGYPAFLGSNMAFVAAAGVVAHVRQATTLLHAHAVPRAIARRVVVAWLAAALAVGGQLAFQLRPLFGIASLTGPEPFMLFDEPTATGARNFYEMVWQLVRNAAGYKLRLVEPRRR
jgi:hypothetical protein